MVICLERGADCISSSGCHCIPKPHHLLSHLNPDWFYPSGSGLPRLSWKQTHPFNGPLSGTIRVSRYQKARKVKPIWILLKQETVSGSGISWAIWKSALRSRQTTTPAPHHSVFTGRMPFLPPNQQRQSTEGKTLKDPNLAGPKLWLGPQI